MCIELSVTMADSCEAWRRRGASNLHNRNRQYHQHQQNDLNHQDDQAVADEMKTERESDLGTKLENQEHDNYYDYDEYYDDVF
ncbi:hypothetical protein ACROYT_G006791 [Oculina patagonica]